MKQAQLSSDKPQGGLCLGLPWKFDYIQTSDLGARKFDKNQTYGFKGSKRGRAKGGGGGRWVKISLYILIISLVSLWKFGWNLTYSLRYSKGGGGLLGGLGGKEGGDKKSYPQPHELLIWHTLKIWLKLDLWFKR